MNGGGNLNFLDIYVCIHMYICMYVCMYVCIYKIIFIFIFYICLVTDLSILLVLRLSESVRKYSSPPAHQYSISKAQETKK
jgi:hypothetical protein